ncbi:unnamed protein product, partial [Staurois parvus]
ITCLSFNSPRYTILPNALGHPSKSLDSRIPITSMATGMQTSTNICERMNRSQELSEFKRGTVIGCHLCNKSISEISLLLNIPRSTVGGIITKWKQLGTTATQPQSGRPHVKNDRSGSVHAEAHSVQKSPSFCRVN